MGENLVHYVVSADVGAKLATKLYEIKKIVKEEVECY